MSSLPKHSQTSDAAQKKLLEAKDNLKILFAPRAHGKNSGALANILNTRLAKKP